MAIHNCDLAPEFSNEICHSRVPKLFGLVSLLALALCFGATARAAQSVKLAWSPDTDSSTTGYMVYSGPASGNYLSRTNVGTNTSTTITGLISGTTNYFAVTAYNAAGVESPPSGEISYLVPGAVRLTGVPHPGIASPVTMQFSVAAGHWYQVQASTDLKNWSLIGQTATNTLNTWFTFQDTQSVAFQRRFYRLVMH